MTMMVVKWLMYVHFVLFAATDVVDGINIESLSHNGDPLYNCTTSDDDDDVASSFNKQCPFVNRLSYI